MDQIKAQLAVVKQYSFWVMCGGILLGTLASWWFSTAKLRSEKEQRVSDITTAVSSVQTILGQQAHPNESTLQQMDNLIRRYAQEVQKGWQYQYDQQASILVWPADFTEKFRAKVDTLRPIEKIPVTGAGTVPFEHDLERDMKEEYRNFIDRELPKLAEIIGALWLVDTFGGSGGTTGGAYGESPGGVLPGGAPGGFGGGFGAPLGGGFGGGVAPGVASGAPAGGPVDASGNPIPIDTAVVLWDPSNQQEILNTHFGFTMRSNLPSTLEVLYAQEDYWVLTNLMEIIKATNGEATARHEAVIKRLDFVRLGRSAMGMAGQVQRLGPVAAGGMMGEGGMAPGGMMPGGMSPGPGSDAAGAAGSPDGGAAAGGAMPGGMTGEGGMGGMESLLARDPAEMRYVDEKYQPLPASRLRGALTSRSPEDALLAVAKRMPVRIRVGIDQRKLNVFLAQCGNAKLPLEVRQVRINRPPAPVGGMGGYGMAGGGGPGYGGFGSGGMAGGFSGSGDGGYGGGGFGGLGGFSALGGGGAMPGGGFGSTAGEGYTTPGVMGGGRLGAAPGSVTADASVDPNMIDVEVYGIVYIYNPVNVNQLNPDVSGGGGAAPAEGTPPTTEAAGQGVPAAPASPAEAATSPAAAPGVGVLPASGVPIAATAARTP